MLYSPQNVIRIIRLSTTRWAVHVAHVVNGHLEDFIVDVNFHANRIKNLWVP